MFHLNFLLVLLAFSDLTVAFYPFLPAYRCIYNDSCAAEKREVEAESYTLKIVRRLPHNGLDALTHAIQGRSHMEHLIQKYIKKRATNTHPVVAAAVPTQPDSAGIDQDGTDYSYFAQVQLGATNTPLYMLLDTGASQTWVMGPDCTSQPCTNHNTFGAANSTSFEAVQGSTWSVQYGSGSCSGSFGNDSVNFAGMTFPVTLGIANTTSNDFNNFPMDGILGLSQSGGQYPTFIQSLVASKTLKSNLFAMSLNRDADGPNTGEISFGSLDGAKYTGSISYTNLSPNTSGDWAIPMGGLSFSGKDAGIAGKIAYIDSGTSYIFGPPAEVAQLHALVPGATSSNQNTWTVPCTTTTPLTVTFSGVTYNVSSEDWVSPMAKGVCTSNVFGHDIITGQWLLGDTFLKNVYTVFDIDGSRVGFGLKPLSSSTSASSTGTNSLTGGQPSMASTAVAVVATGTTSSPSENASNTGPSASTTGQPATSQSEVPGLNGHQTASSGTAAAESTASGSATPTKQSASSQLDTNFRALFFAALVLLMAII